MSASGKQKMKAYKQDGRNNCWRWAVDLNISSIFLTEVLCLLEIFSLLFCDRTFLLWLRMAQHSLNSQDGHKPMVFLFYHPECLDHRYEFLPIPLQRNRSPKWDVNSIAKFPGPRFLVIFVCSGCRGQDGGVYMYHGTHMLRSGDSFVELLFSFYLNYMRFRDWTQVTEPSY